ncbi:UNKNOWN [Stylonychia lemnae]|uniref:DUF8003 domain-containing protein n=1 Tax=Stylonychia lemnae TaxID=5949 RepID=A0A078AC68_STYLE|nr:UNKNOWN [Stylonychia lemnae]|eukprot:CDW79197.1 UNKNOWN [Stylonychia lemnae]
MRQQFSSVLVILYILQIFTSQVNAEVEIRYDLDPSEHLDIYDENFTPENTAIFENGTLWMHQEHHRLKIEIMCFFFNSDAKNCFVSLLSIVFRGDFTYQTNKNIIFNDARFKCQRKDGRFCNIRFTSSGDNTSFELIKNSQLIGEQIVLWGPNLTVKIDASSSINATGTSDEITGTQANQGEGGFCGDNIVKKNYGSYNTYPNFANVVDLTNRIGSQGIKGDINTNGGGRIIIMADSVVLQGKSDKLLANGLPLAINRTSGKDQTTLRHGGSGGYIYLNTSQRIQKNQIDNGVKFQANGGNGKIGGSGGAGGQIILVKVFIGSEFLNSTPGYVQDYQNNIMLNNTQICKHGGPGIVYFQDLDFLTINPYSTPNNKRTFLNGNNSTLILKSLEMRDYTRLSLSQISNLTITSQFRTLSNTSISVFESQQERLLIKTGSQLILNSFTQTQTLSSGIRIQPNSTSQYDVLLYSNNRINANQVILQGQFVGIRGYNISLLTPTITAESKVTNTPTINIYAFQRLQLNGTTKINGNRIWISAQSINSNDEIQMSSSLDDNSVSQGTTGKDISDYHIAIQSDTNINFSKTSTITAASISLQALNGSISLASPQYQTISTKIYPSINIHSNGNITFQEFKNQESILKSLGAIYLISGMIVDLGGRVSIFTDLKTLQSSITDITLAIKLQQVQGKDNLLILDQDKFQSFNLLLQSDAGIQISNSIIRASQSQSSLGLNIITQNFLQINSNSQITSASSLNIVAPSIIDMVDVDLIDVFQDVILTTNGLLNIQNVKIYAKTLQSYSQDVSLVNSEFKLNSTQLNQMQLNMTVINRVSAQGFNLTTQNMLMNVTNQVELQNSRLYYSLNGTIISNKSISITNSTIRGTQLELYANDQINFVQQSLLNVTGYPQKDHIYSFKVISTKDLSITDSFVRSRFELNLQIYSQFSSIEVQGIQFDSSVINPTLETLLLKEALFTLSAILKQQQLIYYLSMQSSGSVKLIDTPVNSSTLFINALGDISHNKPVNLVQRQVFLDSPYPYNVSAGGSITLIGDIIADKVVIQSKQSIDLRNMKIISNFTQTGKLALSGNPLYFPYAYYDVVLLSDSGSITLEDTSVYHLAGAIISNSSITTDNFNFISTQTDQNYYGCLIHALTTEDQDSINFLNSKIVAQKSRFDAVYVEISNTTLTPINQVDMSSLFIEASQDIILLNYTVSIILSQIILDIRLDKTIQLSQKQVYINGPYIMNITSISGQISIQTDVFSDKVFIQSQGDLSFGTGKMDSNQLLQAQANLQKLNVQNSFQYPNYDVVLMSQLKLLRSICLPVNQVQLVRMDQLYQHHIKNKTYITLDQYIQTSQTQDYLDSQPILNLTSSQGSITIQKDIVADKLIIQSQKGISYSNGNIISNQTNAATLKAQNNQQTSPYNLYDVVFMTIDGDIQMNNCAISHQAGVYITNKSISMTQIYSDNLQIYTNGSLSIMQGTNIFTIYEKDFQLNQDKNKNNQFQTTLYSAQKAVIQNLKMKTYSTVISAGDLSIGQSQFLRYSDQDLNRVILNVSSNLLATSFESIVFDSCDVRSQSKSSLADSDKNYELTFISSEGPVSIQGMTKFNSDDLMISSVQNVSISRLNLLIQDQEKGADPDISIQTSEYLNLNEQVTFTGGDMILSGTKGVIMDGVASFYDKKVQKSQRTDYTFQLLSSQGSITSDSLSIDGQNILIRCSDFQSNKLSLESEDYETKQPDINLIASSNINIKQAKIYGGYINLQNNKRFTIQNYDIQSQLNASLPEKDQNDVKSVYILSKDQLILDTGSITSPNMAIQAKDIYLSNTNFNATKVSGYPNLGLFGINTFQSAGTLNVRLIYNQITIYQINGGLIQLDGTNGFSLDNSNFNIQSNQSLINFTNIDKNTINAVAISSNKDVRLSSNQNDSGKIKAQNVRIKGKNVSLYNTLLDSSYTEAQQALYGNVTMIASDSIMISDQSNLQAKNIDLQAKSQLSIINGAKVQVKSNDKIQSIEQFPINWNISQGTIKISSSDIISKQALQLDTNEIYIYSSNIKVEDYSINNAINSNIRLFANNLISISSKTQINSRQLLMLSKSALQITEDSKISSTIQNTCNIDESQQSDLFYCLPKSSTDQALSEQDILQQYMIDYHKENITSIAQIYDQIQGNYTTFILAYDRIKVDSSNVAAPRIGMCSSTIQFTSSIFDTDGRGCPSDSGLGAGVKFEGCAATGAGHGGMGGAGAKLLDSKVFANCEKLHPVSYVESDLEARYEGSGGGSNIKDTNMGGAGGGIIWITAAEKLSMQDTNLTAKGLPGNDDGSGVGNGGGSGGSIQILASKLDGDGHLSVQGGDGSNYGGGMGAGGRIIIYYLGNYLSQYYSTRSLDWLGDLDVNPGNSGILGKNQQRLEKSVESQNGTVWHPRCPSGHSGGFCNPCPIGTYKYGYSYGKCNQCENKPDNSYYTSVAVATALCPYECNSGIDKSDINPDCLGAIDFQIQQFGSQYLLLLVVTLFLLLTMIQWICLIRKQRTKRQLASKRKIKVVLGIEESEKILQLNSNGLRESKLESVEGAIVNKKHIGSIETQEKDLWYHSYRLYLLGFNTIKFPWILTKDMPQNIISEENFKKLENVIQNNHNLLAWSKLQSMAFVVLKVLYPPFATIFHQQIRKTKYTKLRNLLLKTFDKDFWDDYSVNQSIRIQCSKSNYELAQIDFIDYSKQFDDYRGPKLPLIILLSGSGTFNSPYHLDYETDPLIKSIMMIDKKHLRNKLPMYLENLDTLLKRLSFYNLTGQTLKDLNTVLDHVDFGNKHLFFPINAKATLYLFENKFSEDGQQKRRSFPLDSKFFDAFPRTFKILMHYVKLRLYQKKTEIKFGIVFTKNDENKQKKADEKIQLYIQRNTVMNSSAYKKAKGNRNDSIVVQDSTIIEDEDNSLIQTLNKDKQSEEQPTYNINFSIQRQETFFADCLPDEYGDEEIENLEEDNFEEQIEKNFRTSIIDKPQERHQDTQYLETVENQEQQARKLIKRAFSISKNSTKNLELSLRKPRDKCKHKVLKFVSILYSFYTIALQLQAKPPRKRYFMIYFVISLLISLDCLLGLSFLLHLLHPISNMQTIGVLYYGIYPLLPFASPILGLLGTITGSPTFLKQYMVINALLCLFNYPITLISQIVYDDEVFFIMIIFVKLLLKFPISFFGAKVRADLENPHFHKNRLRLKQMTKEKQERMSKALENNDSDDEYEYSSDDNSDEDTNLEKNQK